MTLRKITIKADYCQDILNRIWINWGVIKPESHENFIHDHTPDSRPNSFTGLYEGLFSC